MPSKAKRDRKNRKARQAVQTEPSLGPLEQSGASQGEIDQKLTSLNLNSKKRGRPSKRILSLNQSDNSLEKEVGTLSESQQLLNGNLFSPALECRNLSPVPRKKKKQETNAGFMTSTPVKESNILPSLETPRTTRIKSIVDENTFPAVEISTIENSSLNSNNSLLLSSVGELNNQCQIDFLNLLTLNYAQTVGSECTIVKRASLRLYQEGELSRNIIESLFNNLGSWLNEEITFAYICYLATKSLRRTVVVDSILTDPTIKMMRSSRAIKKGCFNFSEDICTQILIFPLFFGNHWCVLIHDIPVGTYFIDSMLERPSRLDQQNKNYRCERIPLIKKIISEITHSSDEINIIYEDNCSQQPDCYSCGYYICLFAEAWLFNNRNLNLDPIDLNTEKKRILWHINELCKSDNVQYYSRYIETNQRDDKQQIEPNIISDLYLSEDLSASTSHTRTAKKGGRPQKKKRGSGRKSDSYNSTKSSINKFSSYNLSMTTTGEISKDFNFEIKHQKNLKDFHNLLSSNTIEIPHGNVPAPFGRIVIDEVLGSRNLIAEMWADPTQWFSEDFIYVYQRYLSSLCVDKIVTVVSPNYSNLDIHFGPNAFAFNIIDNCYNYSQNYDVLLMTLFFPGHFALIIFDRTDRELPKAFFIDPLPDVDRLYDKYSPGYDAKRFELITNGICELTPGLFPPDFVIQTVNPSEFTRQTDGINCGFFVCLYSESYLFNNCSFLLPNLFINIERRRILWHIGQLITNNHVQYHGRNVLVGDSQTNRASPLYTVESGIEGDCPRDVDGALICVEPVINTEPDVPLEKLSRSSSVLTDSSENLSLRRSPRIQNKNVSNISIESQHSTEQKHVILNPITRRCYKKHEGLPCADVRSKHTVDYYDSGDIGDIICDYCNALLLKSEYEKKNGKISSGTCCNHGKIVLPTFEEFPSPLKNYINAESKEAKEFLSLQNVYNSLVAFASISVGAQESSLKGHSCFLLNGEFVRQISSILPGKFVPSFSQLYILDPTAALERRTQNVKYGGDRVNCETLQKLDSMLRKHHPLAKKLMNFHTQYQKTLVEQGPDAVKNFRLTLIEARDAPVNICDPTLHSRQTNLPDEGDTLFAVWTENEKPPCLKGIWVTNAEGKLHTFFPHHPQTDTLCYPLLFPHGEDGYHKNILKHISDPDNNDHNSISDNDSNEDNDSDSQSVNSSINAVNDSISKRKNVSIREYIRYRMAIRKGNANHNIWSAGGGLTQKFILDYAARIDSDYANFIRKPEFNLRSTLPENILRWLARTAGVKSTEELGSIVLFRRHDPGTRPYFQQKYYNATTIMARFKKPGYASFMLTFTTNPKWREIKRNFLHKNQRTIDRFDIICRIYEDKLKDLHFLIEKRNILGRMIGQESREFQKKYGGPHAHRIYTTDILAIPESVENIIWAHIPADPDINDQSDWANFIRKVREFIVKFQLHDCGPHCLNAKGRCKKGFPKAFSNYTILFDDRPAQYYRPNPQNGGQTLRVKRGKTFIIYDNSRVSSYNPFILVRYETHHNLEFLYGQTNNFKYIYKYPFKGPSFSYVKSKEQQGTVNIDEPAFYAKMLYRSPPEAFSRIMSYKYAFLSHIVIPLSIHLPGQQKIFIKPGQEQIVAQKIQAGQLPETPLTAYWKLCEIDNEIKNTLFERMPETYSFNKSGKYWKKRQLSIRSDKIKKRKPIIGRIYPVSPRIPELFALYLLTKHFPGNPIHLKTVKAPNVCESFIEAARLRGLIDDNNVWIRTMEEGAASLTPAQMRQLFANILIFGSTENCIIDGALLWEKFVSHMYDIRCTDTERPARIERALALLERLLVAQGRQCKDFALPTPQISIIDDPQRGLNEFFFPQHLNDEEIDATVDTTAYEQAKLNAEQHHFFSLIKTAFINSDSPRLFYLCGDGGTGKTFLLNFILYQLRRIGARMIPTASTGMASTRFYSGGTTVHSAFKFGINVEPGILPSISFDSFFGRRIIESDIIIIDEMTMLERVVFENIDALCRLMCTKNKHKPFGGKCVIISGDWKQSLPVVIDSYGTAAQIAACIQSSPLYPLFTIYKLTQSMRVNPNEIAFLNWLDNIGRGIDGDTVAIPSNMLIDSREDLINWVFDRGFEIPSKDLLKRLLLGTTNRIVDINNSLILERFTSSYVDYYSVDKPLNENPMAVNAAEFDVAQINLLNPLGMPHHHLRLKVGSIIVLLINLNTSKGLCNGTRLIVKKLTPNLIEAEAITGGSSRSGITLGIPRHRSTYKDKRPDGIWFERFQFPVRIAFTMTVVKAQGQTCDRLGIDFTEEPFSHGQLYTALSRVTSSEGIRIYAPNKNLNEHGQPLIRNVVARGLQFN